MNETNLYPMRQKVDRREGTDGQAYIHLPTLHLSESAKVRIIWLCVGLCIGITPWVLDYAAAFRDKPGIGGEAIFPLIAVGLAVWDLVRRR